MTKSRPIPTYYTDVSDVEHDITVEVRADGLQFDDVVIETDLPDMPANELLCLVERVAELYWAAEHADYLRTPEAEARGL